MPALATVLSVVVLLPGAGPSSQRVDAGSPAPSGAATASDELTPSPAGTDAGTDAGSPAPFGAATASDERTASPARADAGSPAPSGAATASDELASPAATGEGRDAPERFDFGGQNPPPNLRPAPWVIFNDVTALQLAHEPPGLAVAVQASLRVELAPAVTLAANVDVEHDPNVWTFVDSTTTINEPKRVDSWVVTGVVLLQARTP